MNERPWREDKAVQDIRALAYATTANQWVGYLFSPEGLDALCDAVAAACVRDAAPSETPENVKQRARRIYSSVGPQQTREPDYPESVEDLAILLAYCLRDELPANVREALAKDEATTLTPLHAAPDRLDADATDDPRQALSTLASSLDRHGYSKTVDATDIRAFRDKHFPAARGVSLPSEQEKA